MRFTRTGWSQKRRVARLEPPAKGKRRTRLKGKGTAPVIWKPGPAPFGLKGLPCAKREVEAGRIPPVVLIGGSQADGVKTGQIVVEGKRPKSGVLADFDVETAANHHRERILGCTDARRDKISGNHVESGRNDRQLRDMVSVERDWRAGRPVGAAKQRLEIGSEPRIIAERDARTKDIIGYCGVDVVAAPDPLVNGAKVRDRTEPFVEIVHELSASAVEIGFRNEVGVRVESNEVVCDAVRRLRARRPRATQSPIRLGGIQREARRRRHHLESLGTRAARTAARLVLRSGRPPSSSRDRGEGIWQHCHWPLGAQRTSERDGSDGTGEEAWRGLVVPTAARDLLSAPGEPSHRDLTNLTNRTKYAVVSANRRWVLGRALELFFRAIREIRSIAVEQLATLAIIVHLDTAAVQSS